MFGNRYKGPEGERLVIDQLLEQRVVKGDATIARALAEEGEVLLPTEGEQLIAKGDGTNDVLFILAGGVNLHAGGRVFDTRSAGRSVGEMSAIHPGVPRTATVTAAANTVLLRVSESALTTVADAHPEIWRRFAKDMVERVLNHVSRIGDCNARPYVFVISASESIGVAQAIQAAFAHDNLDVVPWSDQVFRASDYPLEALKRAIDKADFAIAIASPEDLVNVRGSTAKQPRDNVLVELGMAIGALGRERTALLVPQNETVQLPSDFKGLTPITYRDGSTAELAHLLGPACHRLRTEVFNRGVRTDRRGA